MNFRHFLLIFSAFTVLQSCVSKKQMLYLQDLESFNNLELKHNNHTLQVDDILKISVGALMPEAAIPYNSSTGGNVVANSLDIYIYIFMKYVYTVKFLIAAFLCLAVVFKKCLCQITKCQVIISLWGKTFKSTRLR